MEVKTDTRFVLFDHHNDYRDTFILKLNVFTKTNLECCLIITMITGIFVTFMFRLNVVLKNPLVCSFIITVITRIFVTFMFRLNMFLKSTLVCSLIITITAKLFATFMFRQNVCQIWQLARLFVILLFISHLTLRNFFLPHYNTLADSGQRPEARGRGGEWNPGAAHGEKFAITLFISAWLHSK